MYASRRTRNRAHIACIDFSIQEHLLLIQATHACLAAYTQQAPIWHADVAAYKEALDCPSMMQPEAVQAVGSHNLLPGDTPRARCRAQQLLKVCCSV
jgi:crotonobetainyl-CoA:carnitine CoA-transferase CaiB-like acyl-CoA transferase